MKYSKSDMKLTLDNNSFKFKKKFGQNFITDENIINKIVNKSGVDNDTLVIEIGPGAGSLTYKLVSDAGFVLCYEIDKEVETILRNNLDGFNNYEIIFDDFLKRDVNEDLKKYKYNKLMVIANLPYYITTPIITKIIDDNINPDKMVFMVQKEVGDRFKATPGSKDYNSLSIYLNYYFDIKKVMDVSRNVFMPVPNVDSIVVEFNKKDELLYVDNKDLFFKLVRDSFKYKRKTLKNNLKGYNLELVGRVMHNFGYNLSDRAEIIPIRVFVEVANELSYAQKCA
jgi:16S rRNA (adenine1518-N6/adenine1519-N6)-dimethyltransferase